VIGDFLLLLVIAITKMAWWIVVSVVKHARKIVQCSREEIVRGIVLAPQEP
jgi:hypothetical protein